MQLLRFKTVLIKQLTPVEIMDREPHKSLTVCQSHIRTLLDPPHRKRKVCSLKGCQKPASSRRVNLKLSMMLYKVLKQHVPSQSRICWSHLKQANEGEKAASEGHGIAKVNVTELQNQEIETAQLRETLGEDALEMAEVRSTAKKVTQMEEKVGEQEYSRDEAIDLGIKSKEKALVKLFEEKNSKGEEEKAKSEQRLGEAELKTKSWLQKHSPDHVQPAALQDKLDQEQRENELDQHRGVAEHEAELRGEVKLVQLRAEQGFPLKQESPEGKGRKCETAEMM